MATQATATNKDGLTLAEIQRMEREKKLEQMKEQQQMMQIIAQQQAAALAREQVSYSHTSDALSILHSTINISPIAYFHFNRKCKLVWVGLKRRMRIPTLKDKR